MRSRWIDATSSGELSMSFLLYLRPPAAALY
jgi:hypothetical protein